jgi:hypothetical protein
MTIVLRLPQMGDMCGGWEITQGILEIGLAYERLMILSLSASWIFLCAITQKSQL